MNNKKMLFIVEGEKTEPSFFLRMFECLGIDIEIVPVCVNIYVLYRHLSDNSFMLDIDKAILELPSVSEKDKRKIRNSGEFLFTYLVFDFDIQNYDISESENYLDGLNIIKEMLNHFNDETDNTIGKLYINYPMFESYRDCKSSFENKYRGAFVDLCDLKKYKQIVDSRGNTIDSKRLSLCDFEKLLIMNICKAYYIISNNWGMPEYKTYTEEISQMMILNSELISMINKNRIEVINTSVLMLIDYKGNRDGYYDYLNRLYEEQCK